jgi:hypothetical protein
VEIDETLQRNSNSEVVVLLGEVQVLVRTKNVGQPPSRFWRCGGEGM